MMHARLAELNLDAIIVQAECSVAAQHLITSACCREEHRTGLPNESLASALQGEL